MFDKIATLTEVRTTWTLLDCLAAREYSLRLAQLEREVYERARRKGGR